MPLWQSPRKGISMADGSDPSLLDRLKNFIRSFQGQEQAAPASEEQLRPSGHAAWVRQQFDADPTMGPDYMQAAVQHPHIFQSGDAAILIHVEPVVRHFAKDGLTRGEYFKAVAAEPRLLLQKPATVIRNLETVMDHYAADQLMRSDYVQAAVDQPILLRTRPEAVIANIDATADHLEAEGITRSDYLRRAVDKPRLLTQAPQAIRAQPTLETNPALPEDASPGQVATASPLPSTQVQNPVLYVSYVAPAQAFAR